MKTFTLPLSGKVVSIPSTASDWALSATLSDRPAYSLTSGLERAIRNAERTAVERGFKPGPQGVDMLVDQYLGRIMAQWSSHGASAPAPRLQAALAIQGALQSL